MKVGVLCSRLRVEEKLLFEALRKRGADYETIDDRQITLGLAENGF
ncbi:MAG: lysine biosynthesis protein LysX, partial [Anaerolineae bacterium]